MSVTSIIIPARNEGGNIAATIEEIQKEFTNGHITYEIIVVNDGSQDDTAKVVSEFIQKDPAVRLVNNLPPHGIGNAIKKGLDNFKGDYVILAMADASDDPKDMVRYVRELEKGFDCCFGQRWQGAQVKGYPKYKLVINRIANWGIRLIFGINYTDVTNAFKAYSKETIQGIKPILSHHFNITVELPLKAIVRGYSYSVIPTNWRERSKGKTKLKLKEMGSRYIFIILYVWLEKLLCGADYKKK